MAADAAWPEDFPDFAGLYEVSEETDAEGEVISKHPVSPRQAYAIWCAADTIEQVEFQPDPEYDFGIKQRLPAQVAQMVSDEWILRLRQCFADVGKRVAQADYPLARCTGDEFALQLILPHAGSDLELLDDPYVELLPHTVLDSDEDWVSNADEAFLEDDDVMLLFRPGFEWLEEGIDRAPTMNFVNLRSDQWFLPFL